ncbi:FAD binding domain-containing protein [Ditylenchus destructor]|nr:FAD binding domain-containing protein [Ditylenchus destructor]
MTKASLLILFGSETGTAQDAAETVWREARQRRVPARVMAFDDYDIQMLRQEIFVVFIVATSGQGELPTNMRQNWRRLLSKKLQPNSYLAKVNIAVMALGDSSYQKYNFAGKKVYRRLIQLGANAARELGLADDQHPLGVDGAFEPWKTDLWNGIEALKIFEDMTSDIDPNLPLPSKYLLGFEVEKSNSSMGSSAPSDFSPLHVLSNKRVTAEDHFQDTRLITFSLESPEDAESRFKYKPGDVLNVYPYNLQHSVNMAILALEACKNRLDVPFGIQPAEENIPSPPTWLFSDQSTTLRTCLERYFDLNRIADPNLEEKPITIDCLVWFILLRAMDRFQMEKDRFPGTNGVPCGIDSKDLKRRVDILIAETNNSKLKSAAQRLIPQEAIDEICRYGAAEPHVICAIDTRLISFSLESTEDAESRFKYKPGDILNVYPYNLQHSVNMAILALEACKNRLDVPFGIQPAEENIPPPPTWLFSGQSTTLRTCLERYFDLQMIPRRFFLAMLSKFARDPMEKDRLQELSSPQGLDDYLDYCQRPRRTVAELLRDFPATSASLAPQQLFDVMSAIRPRAFSIASSPTSTPPVIQLLVARDTRLITFSLESPEDAESRFKYKPGDVLNVYPYNLQHSVNMAILALEACKNRLDVPFGIQPAEENIPSPPTWLFSDQSTTLRTCLERYFDLQMIPRRSFLAMLSKFARDPMEKDRLQELSSPQGLDDYLDYCQRPRRTVAELLRDFPVTAASLTPQQLFDVMSAIRPRAFSIASSPATTPPVIQLLVARVVYKVRRMAESRRGICSNFLCDLTTGDKVFAKIRLGTFAYNSASPLLLVGPGTGVAPFRSIIRTNERLSGNSVQILLFFGCRNSSKDFYFEDDWKVCKHLTLATAFSRDQPEKFYVQHAIVQNEHVWEYLRNPNAKILIAGSANEMPKEVIKALKRIAESNRIEKVDDFFEELDKMNRIQFETS